MLNCFVLNIQCWWWFEAQCVTHSFSSLLFLAWQGWWVRRGVFSGVQQRPINLWAGAQRGASETATICLWVASSLWWTPRCCWHHTTTQNETAFFHLCVHDDPRPQTLDSMNVVPDVAHSCTPDVCTSLVCNAESEASKSRHWKCWSRERFLEPFHEKQINHHLFSAEENESHIIISAGSAMTLQMVSV